MALGGVGIKLSDLTMLYAGLARGGATVPLVERVPMPGVALLAAGGVAYTVGVVFFLLDSRLRYAHAVWHGFVVAGTSCHFFAVLGYAAA